MRRRGFFAALVGAAGTAAAPAIAQEPVEAPVVAIGKIPACPDCGLTLLVRGVRYAPKPDATALMTCSNYYCRRFGASYELPRVTLTPASLALVERVNAEEKSHEAETRRLVSRLYPLADEAGLREVEAKLRESSYVRRRYDGVGIPL